MKAIHVLLVAFVLSMPPASAQTSSQPSAAASCKRTVQADGWTVDVYSTAVEVYSDQTILPFALPSGFSLHGIQGLTFWTTAGAPALTMRLPIMKDAEGNEVSRQDFHASEMGVLVSEAPSGGGLVRTSLIDRMTSEGGRYTLTGEDYKRTKSVVGKGSVISLDFDFWQPGSETRTVYMRARMVGSHARRGFELYEKWDAWRSGGCLAGEEPDKI